MPKKVKNDTLKFKNFRKKMKVPFVIYADFKTILKKILDRSKTNTKKLQEHVVCGYSYIVACDGQSQPPMVYRGEDANKHFLNAILEENNKINEIFKKEEDMIMTAADIKNYEESKLCWICEKHFLETTRIEKYATIAT